MLTKEQKIWLANGFCAYFEGCASKCPIRHLCTMYDVNLGEIDDDVLDECIKIIAPNLIDEPVRHGLWIHLGDYDSPLNSTWMCSLCKCKLVLNLDDSPANHGFSYCPQCGAKMDLEEE